MGINSRVALLTAAAAVVGSHIPPSIPAQPEARTIAPNPEKYYPRGNPSLRDLSSKRGKKRRRKV